ncbi:MAG: hypothetical protein ACI9CB_002585 [Rhodothermales bacterium]|jgi:hypothetical protein
MFHYALLALVCFCISLGGLSASRRLSRSNGLTFDSRTAKLYSPLHVSASSRTETIPWGWPGNVRPVKQRAEKWDIRDERGVRDDKWQYAKDIFMNEGSVARIVFMSTSEGSVNYVDPATVLKPWGW